MVARKELFTAVRSGAFVPFPWRLEPLDAKTQLYHVVNGLTEQDTYSVIEYLAGVTDKLPNSLIGREKVFCRALRNGLIKVSP